MWTDSQRKIFARVLANSQKREAAIAKLQELRQYLPQYDQQIHEVALRNDNLRMLATVALGSEAESAQA